MLILLSFVIVGLGSRLFICGGSVRQRRVRLVFGVFLVIVVRGTACFILLFGGVCSGYLLLCPSSSSSTA